MKVIFCGVQDISGKKKDGSGTYAFSQLLYLRPIENVTSEKRVVRAYGYEQAEIDLDPSCIDQFADCKVGSLVDVLIEPNPRNVQRNIVAGLKG